MPAEMTARKLEELVREINRLWVGGKPEMLGEYFHENMIMVAPDLKVVGKGREECVKGYIDFCREARVAKYEESKFAVDIWGTTASVSYDFDISYEIEGKNYHDAGRDLFIFSRDENSGEWSTVWRILVPHKG